ncbi:hypothetical protein HMI55_002533 [Coelomomyces lativittatus]|nr:hypothetical protein HMI55_002533 [Coelomomyces lativittatus]
MKEKEEAWNKLELIAARNASQLAKSGSSNDSSTPSTTLGVRPGTAQVEQDRNEDEAYDMFTKELV